MQTVRTIGFDIAKSVFQVHGVDAGGQVIIRRQFEASARSWRSSDAAAMPGGHSSACASSHHWVARAAGTWPYRAIDAAGLREALRQTAEERRG